MGKNLKNQFFLSKLLLLFLNDCLYVTPNDNFLVNMMTDMDKLWNRLEEQIKSDFFIHKSE